MKDQATPEWLLMVLITRTRCSMLPSEDSHSFRMRVVSKGHHLAGWRGGPGSQA